MACCLMAPSHYLNQCWIIIKGVLWVSPQSQLTNWGRVTHICIRKLTIIGSHNGLSPDRRQAIIWTNAGILLISTLGTNFSEIFSKIHKSSFKKIHLKLSSVKWRPSWHSLNGLSPIYHFHSCTKYFRGQHYNLSTDPSLLDCDGLELVKMGQEPFSLKNFYHNSKAVEIKLSFLLKS